MPSDKELKSIYPEVEEFARRMRQELWANRTKGDQESWKRMPMRQAWHEITWHAAKLAVAIRENNRPLIRELAADVANGAMMLDDINDIHYDKEVHDESPHPE